MAHPGVKLIFGGGSLGFGGELCVPETAAKLLEILEQYGVKTIDTAQAYGTGEQLLGEIGAASRFMIDSKYPGGLVPNDATAEVVVEGGKETLKKLHADSLDLFYIHMPDRKHPIEPVLAGINELHKAGMFRRFGVSNFSADEVDEVIRIAKEKNYVLPTVYQGLYSAIARRTETEIFPTLRKYGMAFYAYSPISGGFLTKSRADFEENEIKGRWDQENRIGQLNHIMYMKPGMLQALDHWERVAKEAGVSKAELAYRWVVYNSRLTGKLGDAIIFGGSNLNQLKGTLDGLKNGPLSEEIQGKIDEVWKLVEHEAPLNNLDAFVEKGWI